MKKVAPLIVLCLVALLAAPVSAGDVKVQVANGRVLVQATNATLREILAEWSRVGNVKFVNLEQVASAPMTIDVQWQPENQVLTMLLRSLSGFAAAPKLQAASDSSIFDRVVIMAAPRPAATASATYTQPQQQQPIFRPGLQVVTDDQDPSQQGNTGGLPPGYQVPRGAQAPPMTPAPSVPQGAPGTMSPMPAMPGSVPTGPPGTVSPLPGTQGGTGRQGGPGGAPNRPGGFNHR